MPSYYDEYIQQWSGKDFARQKSRAIFWRKQFGRYKVTEINADKIRAALLVLRSAKCRIGFGRNKTAGKTKEINKVLSNTTVNRYRSVLSAIFTYAFSKAMSSLTRLQERPVCLRQEVVSVIFRIVSATGFWRLAAGLNGINYIYWCLWL